MPNSTIWKYEIEVTDEQYVTMPIGAEIMCVQIQRRKPVIWAMVNPEAERKKVKLITHGTGHEVDRDRFSSYVGTYQLYEGGLVFHVFVGKED